MRLNTSKCPEKIVVRWLDESLGIYEVVKQQCRAHRQHFAPAVIEPYNYELEKILFEEGIKHPLIVINNTLENYNEATLGLKHAAGFQPEHDLLVVYGNQRLRVFDAIEHELDIPYFYADSHVEAILIHNTLQQLITNL